MLHACVTRVWIPGMHIKAEGAGFSAHNTCIRQADTGDPEASWPALRTLDSARDPVSANEVESN